MGWKKDQKWRRNMGLDTKVNGKTTRSMARAFSSDLMVRGMRELSQKVERMDMGSSLLQMATATKGSGTRIVHMAMASTSMLTEVLMRVSGFKTRSLAKVTKTGQTVHVMKVTFFEVVSMELACTSQALEFCTKVSSRTTKWMEQAVTDLLMVVYLMVSGSEGT